MILELDHDKIQIYRMLLRCLYNHIVLYRTYIKCILSTRIYFFYTNNNTDSVLSKVASEEAIASIHSIILLVWILYL